MDPHTKDQQYTDFSVIHINNSRATGDLRCHDANVTSL